MVWMRVVQVIGIPSSAFQFHRLLMSKLSQEENNQIIGITNFVRNISPQAISER